MVIINDCFLMKKKSFPLKKIAVGVIGLFLVAGGVHAFGNASGRKEWQIFNGPIDWVDDLKGERPGCCLPQCGESDQIVCMESGGREWIKGSCENVEQCKLGCCQYDCKVSEQMAHDTCNKLAGEWNLGKCEVGCCRVDVAVIETMPYKTCSDCTGGSWKKGQIYTSFMEMKDSGVFGDNKANWEMNMSLKACGDDPVTANWTGAWDWVWVVQFPDGTYKADPAGGMTDFTPDSSGKASFSIGKMPAQATVSKSKMHVVYPMGSLGDIILDGPIIKE